MAGNQRALHRCPSLIVIATLIVSCFAAPAAHAGTASIDDLMAMELVWEQMPSQYAGAASDSDCVDPVSGRRVWVLEADDFLLAENAAISRVVWWGLYDMDNPPANEVMRFRIYGARASDELPGDVLYEELTTNHTRVETGRHMAASILAREFVYSMDLSTSVLLDADERYWIEISQIGFVDSAFLSVQAYPQGMWPVFLSPYVTDWTTSSWAGTSFQLWATVPEPGSAMLVCLALGAGVLKRRR